MGPATGKKETVNGEHQDHDTRLSQSQKEEKEHTQEKCVDVVGVRIVVLVKGDHEKGAVDEVVLMKARS
jgi:uncharacterized protein (UPF0264 family)